MEIDGKEAVPVVPTSLEVFHAVCPTCSRSWPFVMDGPNSCCFCLEGGPTGAHSLEDYPQVWRKWNNLVLCACGTLLKLPRNYVLRADDVLSTVDELVLTPRDYARRGDDVAEAVDGGVAVVPHDYSFRMDETVSVEDTVSGELA